MEQEQNNMTPMETPATPPPRENAFPDAMEKSGASNYTMIGGLIGLAIIGLGAWYVMKGDTAPTAAPTVPVAPEIVVTPPQTQETAVATDTATDTAAATLKTQGTSDDLNAIDADLKATDLNALNDVNKI